MGKQQRGGGGGGGVGGVCKKTNTAAHLFTFSSSARIPALLYVFPR